MDKKVISLDHLEPFTKNFYEESRRLIRTAMADHNLVIFVGAGVSLDSGMPSWSKAVSQIADKLNISPNEIDSLKIPQYYFNARGKNDYTQLVHQIFKYGIYLQTMPVHKKIIDFNADVMITTNYDHLLEQAAEESGEVLHIVSKDSDLPYKRGKELIKMHGDFEHDNFVLKEDDYLNYGQNFRLIKNYITSLAGTKTILFVGYSFSDPDLKQIFSWLKNVLQGDFRHAYMISVGEYDKYEETYYKNFGINTLYAGLFQKDGEEISKTKRLNRVLDWLLRGDQWKAILDELWGTIGIYRYMQVPYTNHIISILEKYYSVRFINSHDFSFNFILSYGQGLRSRRLFVPSEWDKSSILFLKLCYVAHKSAGDYPGREDIESQEWYKQLDNVKRVVSLKDGDGKPSWKDCLYFKEDEEKKIRILLDIMKKGGLCGLSVLLGNKPIIIPTSGLNIKQDEVLLAMEFFDFQKLEELKNRHEQLLPIGDADAYLHQAHLYYLLKDYVNAYFHDKQAAYLYYRQSDYAGYFIAKCNQRYLGRFVDYRFDKNEVTKKIEEEWRNLDLDKIFMQIPDLTDGHAENQEKNGFLKNLYSFNLAYGMLQIIVKESQKVEDEAKSNYIVYGGTPAYKKLRAQVKNFYYYLHENHLFIDRFKEIKIVFAKAASALITSALAEDKTQDITTNQAALPTQNIHEDEIQVFDLFLAIRYLSANEIRLLFEGRKEGKVSANGREYLSLVSENLSGTSSSLRNHNQYLSSLFAIMSYIKLEDELIASALSMVKRLLSMNLIVGFRQNYNAIIRIIERVGKQSIIKKDSAAANGLLQLVDKILDILPSINDNTLVNELTDTMSTSLWTLNEAQISHDRSSKIRDLLQKGDYGNASFFIYIYPHCSENTKKMISKWLENWISGNSVEDYRTYLVGVQAGAISMSQVRKEEIVKFFTEQEPSYSKHHERKIADSHDQRLVRCILSLVSIALMGKTEDKDWVIKICKDYKMQSALWLLDMNNEDSWKEFRLEWLNQCDSKLLMRIAENKEWKAKIASLIRSDYLQGKLTNDAVLRKYFQYFV